MNTIINKAPHSRLLKTKHSLFFQHVKNKYRFEVDNYLGPNSLIWKENAVTESVQNTNNLHLVHYTSLFFIKRFFINKNEIPAVGSKSDSVYFLNTRRAEISKSNILQLHQHNKKTIENKADHYRVIFENIIAKTHNLSEFLQAKDPKVKQIRNDITQLNKQERSLQFAHYERSIAKRIIQSQFFVNEISKNHSLTIAKQHSDGNQAHFFSTILKKEFLQTIKKTFSTDQLLFRLDNEYSDAISFFNHMMSSENETNRHVSFIEHPYGKMLKNQWLITHRTEYLQQNWLIDNGNKVFQHKQTRLPKSEKAVYLQTIVNREKDFNISNLLFNKQSKIKKITESLLLNPQSMRRKESQKVSNLFSLNRSLSKHSFERLFSNRSFSIQKIKNSKFIQKRKLSEARRLSNESEMDSLVVNNSLGSFIVLGRMERLQLRRNPKTFPQKKFAYMLTIKRNLTAFESQIHVPRNYLLNRQYKEKNNQQFYFDRSTEKSSKKQVSFRHWIQLLQQNGHKVISNNVLVLKQISFAKLEPIFLQAVINRNKNFRTGNSSTKQNRLEFLKIKQQNVKAQDGKHVSNRYERLLTSSTSIIKAIKNIMQTNERNYDFIENLVVIKAIQSRRNSTFNKAFVSSETMSLLESINKYINRFIIFKVQSPTTKRSVTGNFESDGGSTPFSHLKFWLTETGSLRKKSSKLFKGERNRFFKENLLKSFITDTQMKMIASEKINKINTSSYDRLLTNSLNISPLSIFNNSQSKTTLFEPEVRLNQQQLFYFSNESGFIAIQQLEPKRSTIAQRNVKNRFTEGNQFTYKSTYDIFKKQLKNQLINKKILNTKVMKFPNDLAWQIFQTVSKVNIHKNASENRTANTNILNRLVSIANALTNESTFKSNFIYINDKINLSFIKIKPVFNKRGGKSERPFVLNKIHNHLNRLGGLRKSNLFSISSVDVKKQTNWNSSIWLSAFYDKQVKSDKVTHLQKHGNKGIQQVLANVSNKFIKFLFFRVQPPTSKRSVGRNFELGGGETPPDYPKFQLTETSSLVKRTFIQKQALQNIRSLDDFYNHKKNEQTNIYHTVKNYEQLSKRLQKSFVFKQISTKHHLQKYEQIIRQLKTKRIDVSKIEQRYKTLFRKLVVPHFKNERSDVLNIQYVNLTAQKDDNQRSVTLDWLEKRLMPYANMTKGLDALTKTIIRHRQIKTNELTDRKESLHRDLTSSVSLQFKKEKNDSSHSFMKPVEINYYKPTNEKKESAKVNEISKQKVLNEQKEMKSDGNPTSSFSDININQLVDRVYEKLYRKIKFERQRRGL